MNCKWVLMLLGMMVYTPISFTYPLFWVRMSQLLSPQNILTSIHIMILPPILLRKFKQTEDFHRLPASQLTSFYLRSQVNYLFSCLKPIPPPASQIPFLSSTGGHHSSNCLFSVLKVIIVHSLLDRSSQHTNISLFLKYFSSSFCLANSLTFFKYLI